MIRNRDLFYCTGQELHIQAWKIFRTTWTALVIFLMHRMVMVLWSPNYLEMTFQVVHQYRQILLDCIMRWVFTMERYSHGTYWCYLSLVLAILISRQSMISYVNIVCVCEPNRFFCCFSHSGNSWRWSNLLDTRRNTNKYARYLVERYYSFLSIFWFHGTTMVLHCCLEQKLCGTFT